MLTAICDKCGKEEKITGSLAKTEWRGPLHIVKPIRKIGVHLCPDCGIKLDVALKMAVDEVKKEFFSKMFS